MATITAASGFVAVTSPSQEPSRAVPALQSAPMAGPPQQPSGAIPGPSSPRAVLNRYCVSCHNEKLRTAELMLDKMDVANVSAGVETWEKVVRKLRSRAMPPAGRLRPDEATYEAVASQLETDLDRLAAAAPNPGTLPAFHRLTRTEYRNAIRDLLALGDLPKSVDLASLLPADNSSTGFDNLADLLFVSSTQLEQYLSAAQKISRLAVGDLTIRPIVDTYRLLSEHSQDVHVEGLPLGTRGGTAIRTALPLDGEYSIHIELSAAPREPHQLEVSVDGERVGLFTVSDKPEPDQPARAGVNDVDSAPLNRSERSSVETSLELDPGTAIQIDSNVVNRRFERDRQAEARRAAIAKGFDLVLPLKAGPRVIVVTFIKHPSTPTENIVMPRLRGAGQLPGVASVTLKGPQNATGPGDTLSRRRIFVCRPPSLASELRRGSPEGGSASASAEADCARKILSTLARRAYRRPVTDADIQVPLAFYRDARATEGVIR